MEHAITHRLVSMAPMVPRNDRDYHLAMRRCGDVAM
jgi:hypothetical protein